jgi:3-phenylpropionate/trans-cinnamate dioxygenase ferredoxin component
VSVRRLCAVDDVRPGTAERFVVDGHKVCLVRLGDDFYAIGDTCSHAEVSLSEGEIDEETLHLECWKHGSCFSLVTGEPDTLPATRPVPTYAVSVRDGDVSVELP